MDTLKVNTPTPLPRDLKTLLETYRKEILELKHKLFLQGTAIGPTFEGAESIFSEDVQDEISLAEIDLGKSREHLLQATKLLEVQFKL